jgi:hypothetical protein
MKYGTGWDGTCPCHGERASFSPDARYTEGGYWRCLATRREEGRNAYANLSGVEYHRLLLKRRRTKALARHRGRSKED